jgi:2-hydroxychromene-2-carboxylate isomerase
MTTQVEFYFDFGSPTAYLAHCRLNQLAQQFDLNIQYRPILLGGVFKATENTSPVAIPAKGKYMLEQDLPRFAQRYGVPLNFNPHFPINTLQAMRGVFAAQRRDCADAYIATVFDGMWVQGLNLGDTRVLQQALESADIDADALLALTQDAQVKADLISATEAAVARRVFGAPTLFIGDAMYFGQDRLDFIEEHLQAKA